MTKLVITVVLLGLLNGCAMTSRVTPMAIAPGATAFSSGYSGGDGGSGTTGPTTSDSTHWGAVAVALGFLTALVGGCFVLSERDEMCFSILEGILAH